MTGSLYLITAPTIEVVSVATAREQLRLSSEDSDSLIRALVSAAAAQLDPASGGWLGRALRPQTWELRIDRFPCVYDGSGYSRDFRQVHRQDLPYPPLISVVSVKYDDADGNEQTLIEDTDFRVIGQGSTGRASIAPIYQGSWPSSVRCDQEAVRIRYTAGYLSGSGYDNLPASIKQAVLLNAKYLYGLAERNLFLSADTVDGVGSQQFTVSQNASQVMSAAVESLLSPYRVWE